SLFPLLSLFPLSSLFPLLSLFPLPPFFYACFFKQDKGGCENYTLKWYFDTTQSECSRFWYGGCGGNANRFETQETCEGLCLRRNSTHPPVCPVPSEPPVCPWYFDTTQSECSRFWYGGCGGNANRFETQEACEGLCLRRNSTHINSYQTKSSTRQCTVNLDVNRTCKFRLYVIRSVFVNRICCTVCLFPLT
uniref:BPTI/Kunitz inhibitor domain-containing protein n=1 Tax=Oncorhynchus mykiss TaxID=8022 RepID=A0A8C7NLK0_ONCMY